MKPTPTTIALIGLGGISKAHIRAINETSDFQLIAVCDSRDEALEAWQDHEEVSCYKDLDLMISQSNPDMVIVATPDASHAEITMRVVPHKPKVILCEKPMAVHFADAKKMVEACEAAGTVLLINHQRRLVAGEDIYQSIQRGDIGDLLELEARCPGDLIGDGTHAIDTLLYMTREAPKNPVWGMIDTGNADGTIDLRYGRAKERAASAIWYDEHNVRYAVHTGACIERTPYQSYRIRGTAGELWHPGGTTQPAVYLNNGQPGTHVAAWDEHGWYLLPKESKGGPWRRINPDSGSINPMTRSLELLTDLLLGNIDSHPLEGTQAIQSLEILTAAYQAALNYCATELPLPADTRLPLEPTTAS